MFNVREEFSESLNSESNQIHAVYSISICNTKRHQKDKEHLCNTNIYGKEARDCCQRNRKV